MSQQADFQATKKRDTERTAEVGKYNFEDTYTKQTFQELKLGVYEDYEQPHAKLPAKVFQNTATGTRPARNTYHDRTKAR